MTLDLQIAFLTEHGAQLTEHSSRSLMIHLRSTEKILAAWNAGQTVRSAGLFHSVYGTESFSKAILPLGLREKVSELIGEEAEQLAYWFGAHQNESFRANKGRNSDFSFTDRFTDEQVALTTADWSDLCELFLANALEQIAHIAPERRQRFYSNYEWVCSHVSIAASNAFSVCKLNG